MRVADTSRPKVNTWEALKQELREQFLLGNAAWVGCEALSKLRQTGSVRDYVNRFALPMLDIRAMNEDDRLFNFVSGLQAEGLADLDLRGAVDSNHEGVPSWANSERVVRGYGTRPEKGVV
ncbi:hypothetical protein AMTR_s00007p00248630 [Amborella trichopoda]|uniref:Retrotransposon gag domain-containing protein n=1 Tax=Amborella trichopoda TaxID=13333 RepID=W1PBY8_AMBTC|nr:hypothetical protein AMTR_s00007p00248630 [Amborella trichopoda]